MKKNMSNMDRTIRLVVAAILLILFFTNTVTGTLSYILLGVAVIFIGTSLVNVCLIYKLLGIRTNKG